MASGNTTITATIARVNAHGFQTREDPGKWLNVSKYASPAPTIPPIGTKCRITVDAAGFVRAIEVLSEQQPPDAADVPPDAPGATERPRAQRLSKRCQDRRARGCGGFLGWRAGRKER